MKTNKKWLLLAFVLTLSGFFLVPSVYATGIDGGYVGTSTCLSCHDGAAASDKTGFTKTGHPYKYRHTGGATPTDPLTELYLTPLGLDVDTATLGEDCGGGLVVCNGSLRLDWPAINYAIGGYGWKIRWGVRDSESIIDPIDARTGYVWAGTTQYNILNNTWSAYNANSDKKNECAKCHQTNGMVFTGGYSCYTDPVLSSRTEPLGNNPGMSLVEDNSAAGGDDDGICETGEGCKIGGYRSMWTFDGVQCEACHGKGSNSTNNGHADGTGTQGVLTLAGDVEICAKCHIRAENTAATGAECDGGDNPDILTNGAKITDPWIGHHEQYNEMNGYNGDGVHASLTCTTCHDPHKRAVDVIGAVATALGITGDNTKPEDGAIKKQCADCHSAQADADAAAIDAGRTAHAANDVTCIDCHMAEATKTATNSSTAGWGRKGDLKTHIFDINPTGSTIVRSNGFTNIAQNYITPKYSCGKCHDSNIYGSVIAGPTSEAAAQTEATNYHNVTGIDGGYVGSNVCSGCHTEIYDDFLQTGHPWKYKHTGGTTPPNAWDPLSALFPRPYGVDIDTASLGEDCGDGLVVCDSLLNLDWSAINYTIGGFGWKIRWGVKDTVNSIGTTKTGYVWTSLVSSPTGAQYNIENGSWSAYNGNNNKKYECAVCHQTNGKVITTGYDCIDTSPRTEPWASNPGMDATNSGGYYSQWSLDGVQCEACHGPAKDHVTSSAALGVLETSAGVEICAKCHIRAENTAKSGSVNNAECGGDSNSDYLTNGAKSNSDFIQHHEQYNELAGLNGDGVHTSLDCTTCHDPHKRTASVISAVAVALGITGDNTQPAPGAIKATCESCHPGKSLRYYMGDIKCIDCHMPEATKSATSESGTWGKKGDLKTHIFAINSAGTTLTRSNGFTNVAVNALPVDYACGKCHDLSIPSATQSGAPNIGKSILSVYAKNIHINSAPTASMSIDVSDYTVTLTDTSTDDSIFPANALKVKWGDGTSSKGDAGGTISHTYSKDGKYAITYTVTDSDGLTNSKTKTVAIPERFSIIVNLSPALSSNATFVLKKNGVTKTNGKAADSYTFSKLKPGTYQVKMSKPGYTFDGDGAGSDDNPVTVTIVSSDQTVTFTHTP